MLCWCALVGELFEDNVFEFDFRPALSVDLKADDTGGFNRRVFLCVVHRRNIVKDKADAVALGPDFVTVPRARFFGGFKECFVWFREDFVSAGFVVKCPGIARPDVRLKAGHFVWWVWNALRPKLDASVHKPLGAGETVLEAEHKISVGFGRGEEFVPGVSFH